MAKRFTDTTKWGRQNFRELAPKLKLAWLYVLDNCDHCGVWNTDFELLSFQIGIRVTREEFFEAFGGQIRAFKTDKLFFPAFIEFQYPELSDDCKAHTSVIAFLKRNGFWSEESKGLSIPDNPSLTVTEGLGNPYVTVQDKDKDKDQYKEKEKEKEERTVWNFTRGDFENLYGRYPRKEGKSKGLALCKAQIKTFEDYNDLATAIDRYVLHVRSKEPAYIKHFSTFMGAWRDWLDPDAGATVRTIKSSAVPGGQRVPDAEETRVLLEEEIDIAESVPTSAKSLIDSWKGAAT